MSDSERTSPWVLAIAASQMGLFVATGLLAGLWLDRKWGTMPILGFVGLILGFLVGIQLIAKLMRMGRKHGT